MDAEDFVFEFYEEKLQEQKDNRLKDKKTLLAYHNLKKDPNGRIVLWDILDFAGVFRPTFTGNSRTYFNEGRRDMGLYILTMLQIADGLEGIDEIKRIKPGVKDGSE